MTTPSWGALTDSFSMPAWRASTRPFARSRWLRSERSSDSPRDWVARLSAWMFSRSRSRPRRSSRAFSSSSRCCTSAGTSALRLAFPRSASAWAACCSISSSLRRRSTSFCSTFLVASASSACFSASCRCKTSVSNPSTGWPFLTAVPSGIRKAILNSTSVTGGVPISVERTAASSPSSSTLKTRSSRLTGTGLDTSGPEGRRAAKPKPARTATPNAAAARRGGRYRRRPSVDEDTVALRQPRLDHALHRRAGGDAHRARSREALLHDHGLLLVEADRLARHHEGLGPGLAHHFDAHRKPRAHQGVGLGEGHPHREAGPGAHGPESAPGLRRHRPHFLDAPLEDPVGVGVEDAAGREPGGDAAMVDLGQVGPHLHLRWVGDRGHRVARPDGVARLQLAGPLGPPLPEVSHQEDPALRGLHGHAHEGLLRRRHLPAGLLLGSTEHFEVRAGGGLKSLPLQASLLEGRMLLLQDRLQPAPLDGRLQLAGHGRVEAGLLGLDFRFVDRDPLPIGLRGQRPLAALPLVLGLPELQPALFDVLDEARRVELDHALALGNLGAIVDHPTDLELPLPAGGDD